MTGVQLIAEERRHQEIDLGYTYGYDMLHEKGELVRAAIYYAAPQSIRNVIKPPWPITLDNKSRVEQLKIAGALIAAEIDRIQG